MIKYLQTEVVFSEIPDEVTLAVNITNCQHNCKGCHSPYLKQDIGQELTEEVIDDLIKKNDGITCFCFMGEGNDKERLKELVTYIKNKYHDIKIGLFSGSEDVDDFFWNNIECIKIGPYIEEFGPLNKETTNQRLYRARHLNRAVKVNGKWRSYFEDITYKFWEKKL